MDGEEGIWGRHLYHHHQNYAGDESRDPPNGSCDCHVTPAEAVPVQGHPGTGGSPGQEGGAELSSEAGSPGHPLPVCLRGSRRFPRCVCVTYDLYCCCMCVCRLTTEIEITHTSTCCQNTNLICSTPTHTRNVLSLPLSLSPGPSVLDVFRTLVRHLRISIEDCGSSTVASTNSAFQVNPSLSLSLHPTPLSLPPLLLAGLTHSNDGGICRRPARLSQT